MPGTAPSARVSGCPSRMIGKSEGSERRQTPPEVRGKRRPAPPHLLHTGPCKNAGVHTHTHTHSGGGENYTRLTPQPLSKHQHQGWMVQWLDPTKDLARRLARRASCPWLAQHPPPTSPTRAEGDSGKAKGERKYAGASGGCLVTKEVGRASARQASGARRLPPKPPVRLQARGPREGPAGFAPDSLKQRSPGPRGCGAPWIPSGSAPQGLARAASWRGEAGGSLGFG